MYDYLLSEYPEDRIKTMYIETQWKITGIINNSYKDEQDTHKCIQDDDIKYQMRTPYATNEECDLAAMLYVVTNCVLGNFNNLRLEDVYYRCYGKDEKHVKSRLDFYDKIAKKYIKVRGESLFFEVPQELSNNPVLSCATAFCDIVKNPMLIDDYENAPIKLEDFDINCEFIDEVAMPIIEVVAKYASDIIHFTNNYVPQPHTLGGLLNMNMHNSNANDKLDIKSIIGFVLYCMVMIFFVAIGVICVFG